MSVSMEGEEEVVAEEGRDSIQDTSLPREKVRTADWKEVERKKRRGETKKEKKKSRKRIQSE